MTTPQEIAKSVIGSEANAPSGSSAVTNSEANATPTSDKPADPRKDKNSGTETSNDGQCKNERGTKHE